MSAPRVVVLQVVRTQSLSVLLCASLIAAVLVCSGHAQQPGTFLSPGMLVAADTVTVSVAREHGEDTLDAVWFRVRFRRDTTLAAPGPAIDTLLGLDTVPPFSVVWECGTVPDQDEPGLLFYCEALTRTGRIVGGPESFTHQAARARGPVEHPEAVLEVPYSRQPVVFDGDLSEWPSVKAMAFGRSDAPVRMQAFWNEGFVCVGLSVPSPEGYDLGRDVAELLSPRESACGTGVALHLDILHDRSPARRDDDATVVVSTSGAARTLRSPANDTARPLVGVRTTAQGYTMEVALTCASLGLSPYRNQHIGFGLSVFACDTARAKTVFLDWSGNPRLSASLPSRWGTMALRRPRPWWHFAAAPAALLLIGLGLWYAPRPRRKRGLLRDLESYSLTVRYAIQLLDENSHLDELDLRELAEALYLTGPRLARMIQRETGLKVKEFITAVRLTKARRLLVETVMPISEIAESVGLGSARAFEAAFEEVARMSPTAYRMRHGVAIYVGTAAPREEKHEGLNDADGAGATADEEPAADHGDQTSEDGPPPEQSHLVAGEDEPEELRTDDGPAGQADEGDGED